MRMTWAGVALALTATVPATAASVPEALRNHSISISWSDDRTIRDPEGQTKMRTQVSSMTVYVSSAGRVFSRFERSTGRRDTTTNSQVSGGSDDLLHWSYEAGGLIADQHFDRGARRVMIQFGAGYADCSLRVLHGKEAGSGPIVYTGYNDRVKYEVVSIAVTSTNCSLAPGNAFDAGK